LRIGPKLITASALDSIAVLPEGKGKGTSTSTVQCNLCCIWPNIYNQLLLTKSGKTWGKPNSCNSKILCCNEPEEAQNISDTASDTASWHS